MKISYGGKIVRVIETDVKPEEFADRVFVADKILSYFPASQRNMWGTDGVGYALNKEKGIVERNLSAVGPRQYAKTLPTVLQHFPQLKQGE